MIEQQVYSYTTTFLSLTNIPADGGMLPAELRYAINAAE
jgi:hypothetical protein